MVQFSPTGQDRKRAVLLQRANRKLRALAYKFETDAYGAPDLSVLAEHMTESGIVDMAYQQEPESIIWMVRANGGMATLTIDRDQDVGMGPANHRRRLCESVATIPVGRWRKYGPSLTEPFRARQSAISSAWMPTRDRLRDRGDQASAVRQRPGQASASGRQGRRYSGRWRRDASIHRDKRNRFMGGQCSSNWAALHERIELMTPELAWVGSAQGNSMRVAEITVRFP